MKLIKLIRCLDLSKHIVHHIVGPNHTAVHHRTAGFVVMFIGVSTAHLAHYIPTLLIQLLVDLIGYALHAVGLIPFISNLEKSK